MLKMKYGLLILLVVLSQVAVVDSNVIINEVMYNPNQCTDSYCEWIELYNPTASAVDVSGWGLSDDTATDTLEGTNTVIPAYGYAIITDKTTYVYSYFNVNASAIRLTVDDESIGNGLGNSGESIGISSGNYSDSMTYYGNELAGYSTEKIGSSWTESVALGGTPGSANGAAATTTSTTTTTTTSSTTTTSVPIAAVIINEIMYDPNQCSDTYCEWIELYNPTGSSVNISNWTISDDSATDTLMGTTMVIPAYGYAIITDVTNNVYSSFNVSASAIRLTVDDESIGNGLGNTIGETITLSYSTYSDSVSYSIGGTPGYSVEKTGSGWAQSAVDGGTPGSANSGTTTTTTTTTTTAASTSTTTAPATTSTTTSTSTTVTGTTTTSTSTTVTSTTSTTSTSTTVTSTTSTTSTSTTVTGTTTTSTTSTSTTVTGTTTTSTTTTTTTSTTTTISGELEVTSAQASLGETVTVDIRVNSAPNEVSAFGFDLTYDGDVLLYQAYWNGSIIEGYDYLGVNDISLDTVRVGAFTTQNAIQAGESGSILEVDFTVVGCYNISLGLTNLVDDVSSWEVSNGTFTCTGAATTTTSTTTTSSTTTTLDGVVEYIDIGDSEFFPNPMPIVLGRYVRWINFDAIPHQVMMDSGQGIDYTSAVLSQYQESTVLLINDTGTYTYHCHLHPEMTGTIEVNAETTTTLGECLTGDLDCDGTVGLDEVVDVITLWTEGQALLSEVVEAITNWEAQAGG